MLLSCGHHIISQHQKYLTDQQRGLYRCDIGREKLKHYSGEIRSHMYREDLQQRLLWTETVTFGLNTVLRDGHGTRVGAGYGGHRVSHHCEIHQRGLIGKALDFSHAKTLVTRTGALFTRVI